MKSSPEYTIGQLAAHFGLAPHVLRHWEAVGLITPARRVNGRRRYGPDHMLRIAIIRHGKEVGFSLPELRQMVTADDPEARRDVLRRHRDDLLARIATAQASLTLIDHALACPAEDFISCPEFTRLVHDLDPPACVVKA